MNEHDIESGLDLLARAERGAARAGIESRIAAATLVDLCGERAAVPDMRLSIMTMRVRTGVRIAAAVGLVAVLGAAWMARTPAGAPDFAVDTRAADWAAAAAIVDEVTGGELASLYAEAETLDAKIRAGWTMDDAMLTGEAM